MENTATETSIKRAQWITFIGRLRQSQEKHLLPDRADHPIALSSFFAFSRLNPGDRNGNMVRNPG